MEADILLESRRIDELATDEHNFEIGTTHAVRSTLLLNPKPLRPTISSTAFASQSVLSAGAKNSGNSANDCSGPSNLRTVVITDQFCRLVDAHRNNCKHWLRKQWGGHRKKDSCTMVLLCSPVLNKLSITSSSASLSCSSILSASDMSRGYANALSATPSGNDIKHWISTVLTQQNMKTH